MMVKMLMLLPPPPLPLLLLSVVVMRPWRRHVSVVTSSFTIGFDSFTYPSIMLTIPFLGSSCPTIACGTPTTWALYTSPSLPQSMTTRLALTSTTGFYAIFLLSTAHSPPGLFSHLTGHSTLQHAPTFRCSTRAP